MGASAPYYVQYKTLCMAIDKASETGVWVTERHSAWNVT